MVEASVARCSRCGLGPMLLVAQVTGFDNAAPVSDGIGSLYQLEVGQRVFGCFHRTWSRTYDA